VDPVGHVTKVKEIKMEPPQAMKGAQAVLRAEVADVEDTAEDITTEGHTEVALLVM